MAKKSKSQRKKEARARRTIEPQLRSHSEFDVLSSIVVVELADAIFDTDQLSVVRGGSFAALLLPMEFKSLAETRLGQAGMKYLILHNGASETEIFVECPDTASSQQAIKILEGVFDEVRGNIGIDLASGGRASIDTSFLTVLHHSGTMGELCGTDEGSPDPARALTALQNRLKRQQAGTGGVFISPQHDFDSFEGSKSASLCSATGNRISGYDGIGGRPLSWIAKQRFDFGREMRQSLREVLIRDGSSDAEDKSRASARIRSANNLHEISGRPFGLRGIPQASENKLAVIHLDGNGWGQERKKLSGNYEKLASRTEDLRRKQRGLLEELLKFAENPSNHLVDHDTSGEAYLKLEVLLWGGDEIAVAVPGWAALSVLDVLQKYIKSHWGGDSVSCGLFIGAAKTPIRQMRRAASELSDQAKYAHAFQSATGNAKMTAQILVSEGVDLAEQPVLQVQKSLLGLDHLADDEALEHLHFLGSSNEHWMAGDLIKAIVDLRHSPVDARGEALSGNRLNKLLQAEFKEGPIELTDNMVQLGLAQLTTEAKDALIKAAGNRAIGGGRNSKRSMWLLNVKMLSDYVPVAAG